jgi:hypothetical protein
LSSSCPFGGTNFHNCPLFVQPTPVLLRPYFHQVFLG